MSPRFGRFINRRCSARRCAAASSRHGRHRRNRHLGRLGQRRRQRLLLLLVLFLQFLLQAYILRDVVRTGVAVDGQRPVLEGCRSQLWNALPKGIDPGVFGTAGRQRCSATSSSTGVGSYRTATVMAGSATDRDVAGVVRRRQTGRIEIVPKRALRTAKRAATSQTGLVRCRVLQWGRKK